MWRNKWTRMHCCDCSNAIFSFSSFFLTFSQQRARRIAKRKNFHANTPFELFVFHSQRFYSTGTWHTRAFLCAHISRLPPVTSVKCCVAFALNCVCVPTHHLPLRQAELSQAIPAFAMCILPHLRRFVGIFSCAKMNWRRCAVCTVCVRAEPISIHQLILLIWCGLSNFQHIVERRRENHAENEMQTPCPRRWSVEIGNRLNATMPLSFVNGVWWRWAARSPVFLSQWRQLNRNCVSRARANDAMI